DNMQCGGPSAPSLLVFAGDAAPAVALGQHASQISDIGPGLIGGKLLRSDPFCLRETALQADDQGKVLSHAAIRARSCNCLLEIDLGAPQIILKHIRYAQVG